LAVATSQPPGEERHVASAFSVGASLPGFPSALGCSGVPSGGLQGGTMSGVAGEGLGQHRGRLCSQGWALTGRFWDIPHWDSPCGAVASSRAGSVPSVVTGPGLAFSQIIGKLQCCWV